jgi:hypothetical protein
MHDDSDEDKTSGDEITKDELLQHIKKELLDIKNILNKKW